jgi:glutathione S-transferase
MSTLEFVDLDTARAARGVRLVVTGALPSPWGEAAKELFHLAGIPVQAVRFRRDDAALAAWTRASNVPVVLNDDEPPRTGWAEILALAHRLGPDRQLIPDDPEARVRLFGLAHELVGENGLAWSSRLIMIDGGLTTEGARGFPLPVARFLAPKYGYAPDRIPAARARIRAVAALFERQLAASRAAGHQYLLGPLTALDVYLATCFTPAADISDADCPALVPPIRAAFAHLHAEVAADLPPALLAHRALMFERHLRYPIPL